MAVIMIYKKDVREKKVRLKEKGYKLVDAEQAERTYTTLSNFG